nr:hypothetical protein [uncultured Rhodoferax sp.]
MSRVKQAVWWRWLIRCWVLCAQACRVRECSSPMNNLNNFESLGLVLPSPAYLLGAILFGLVGYVAFRYGRRSENPPLTWAGVALMAYPYAVSQTWLLWVIGAALCGWVYLKWR